jgi:hypothetical protein
MASLKEWLLFGLVAGVVGKACFTSGVAGFSVIWGLAQATEPPTSIKARNGNGLV